VLTPRPCRWPFPEGEDSWRPAGRVGRSQPRSLALSRYWVCFRSTPAVLSSSQSPFRTPFRISAASSGRPFRTRVTAAGVVGTPFPFRVSLRMWKLIRRTHPAPHPLGIAVLGLVVAVGGVRGDRRRDVLRGNVLREGQSVLDRHVSASAPAMACRGNGGDDPLSRGADPGHGGGEGGEAGAPGPGRHPLRVDLDRSLSVVGLTVGPMATAGVSA